MEYKSKYNELLNNVRNLQSDMESTSSLAEALELEGELYRKLTLAGWVLRMETRAFLEEKRNPKQRAYTLQREVKQNGFLKVCRREVKAVKKYLVKTLSCNSKPEGEGPKPQDKLNLLKAIPGKSQLVDWNRIELEFEVQFLKKMQTDELKWKDNRKLWLLAETSIHHRKVILKHFETFLMSNIRHSDFLDVKSYCHVMNFPVTRQVKLDFQADETIQHGAISEWGHQIWDAYVHVPTDLSAKTNLNLQRFLKCLELLPNLRRMEIRDDTVEMHNEYIQDFELSPLSYLRSLVFQGGYGFADMHLFRKLLATYGENLVQLTYQTPYPILYYPVDLPACDKVTSLTFGDLSSVPWSSCGMALRFLYNFRNAPLQFVYLKLREESVRNALYQLLGYLGKNFGETLQHLELLCGDGNEAVRDNMTPPPPMSLLDVKFPKLQHFCTDIDPQPDGWEYLLLFPALETLKVAILERCEKLKNDETGIWLDPKSLRRWKLWKLLPRLKFIDFCNGPRVTREETISSRLRRLIIEDF